LSQASGLANDSSATPVSIADIGCWGRMVFMSEGSIDIDEWPNVEAWSGRLKAMPGFALPYDLIPNKDQEMVPA
jgi:glutathione S-transferase